MLVWIPLGVMVLTVSKSIFEIIFKILNRDVTMHLVCQNSTTKTNGSHHHYNYQHSPHRRSVASIESIFHQPWLRSISTSKF